MLVKSLIQDFDNCIVCSVYRLQIERLENEKKELMNDLRLSQQQAGATGEQVKLYGCSLCSCVKTHLFQVLQMRKNEKYGVLQTCAD